MKSLSKLPCRFPSDSRDFCCCRSVPTVLIEFFFFSNSWTIGCVKHHSLDAMFDVRRSSNLNYRYLRMNIGQLYCLYSVLSTSVCYWIMEENKLSLRTIYCAFCFFHPLPLNCLSFSAWFILSSLLSA